MALACTVMLACSAVVAWADWLRRHPTETNVTEAIRWDPLNPYAYTLRAELLERAGRFGAAERAWSEALQRNPRDAEAWMRIALLSEQRGAVNESEQYLLRAAEVCRMWLPRWALVNFYARHGRREDLYKWSRRALERASGDVGALFPILQEAGAPSGFLLDILPRNRNVVAAWLAFQLQHSAQQTELEQGAVQLASLIPQTVPGWPGADITIWPNRIYPAVENERTLLLAVVDRLLDGGKGAEAVRLWNLLINRQIVSGNRWTVAAPITNRQFRFDTCNGGLDWLLSRVDHVDSQFASESGEFVVRLDGHQPEFVELLKQRAYIPAGAAYQLAIESRTEGLADGNSLEWQILDRAGNSISSAVVHPSEDWRRETAYLSALGGDRIVAVVLTCKRPLGSIRAEGTARFRLVSLEHAH